jgi:Ran GTPase-activating protein 1
MAADRIFSLEGKGLKLDTAEDIAPHIQPLKRSADVTEVRFLGNTLGIGASEALAEVLASKTTLEVANFADVFTGRVLAEIPPALDALLSALVQLPKLHTINLSDNAFGLNTQAPLVSFLAAHTPLEHLILNNNGLGPYAGVLIADALTTLAKKKMEVDARPLRTVVCGRNRLENGSMAAWAKAYAAHDGVTSIKMVQNGIRQEGITHLLKEGLLHTTGLEVLDLQDNTFTVKGARTLADVIARWPSLKELGVGDCLLSARGGVMLGEALRAGNNKELEVLRLQFNDVDGKTVKLLAEIQQFVPKLRRVELNGNKFNEDDVNVDLLRSNLYEQKKNVGNDDDDEDNWGLDELDELDDESEDEEDEDKAEEAEEAAEEKELVLKRADEAEEENVPLEDSEQVDKLAELLGKTGI